MEKQQNEDRWFTVKHESCQGIFTLNAEIFPESQKKWEESNIIRLRCPTCGSEIVEVKDLREFFDNHKVLLAKLREFKDSGFTIKQKGGSTPDNSGF